MQPDPQQGMVEWLRGILRPSVASMRRWRQDGWARLRTKFSQMRLRWRRLPATGRWEVAAYGALLAVALGMRLWDLGGRSLHYDELLHAWYAWGLSEGGSYNHTPVTHGPFLFHLGATSNLLLGSSDVVARLMPALFGVILVGMPWFLRRELGRPGAFITALLLSLSPSMLYFSRFLRNDIYMAVWVLALVIIMRRYIQRPQRRLLFLWVGLWSLAFTTKETSYLAAGILGLPLLMMSLPQWGRWVAGRVRLSRMSPPGVLLLVLVTVTLPLWAPVLGLAQDLAGIVLVNADPNDPMAKEVRVAIAETGAPAGGALYIAAFAVVALAALSVTVGLLWDRKRWPFLALLFVAIWLPLYTTFFSNGQGFFTGLWGSLGYWIAQQPVERAGQPWHFYVILGANYEFLIMIPALVAVPVLLCRGRSFDRFLVYWAAATFLVFTLAGERMPWLMVGISLPFALVTGRSVGLLLEWVPWRDLDWRRAALAGTGGAAFLVLATIAVLRVVRSDDFANGLWFWGAVAVGFGTLGLVLWGTLSHRLYSRVGRYRSQQMSDSLSEGGGRLRFMPTVATLMSFGMLVVLMGTTAFVAGRATYSYAEYERPVELLVYSQTGQETTWIAQRIERIAQESGKGKAGLRVLVGESDNFAWQWRWYLRDYDLVTIRALSQAPLTEPPDVDVVLMSKAVEGSNQAVLTGFTRAGQLKHLWWFPNPVFKELSLSDAADGFTSRQAWRGALDYFFSRRVGTPMYQSTGVLYLANEYVHIK
jgi:uncharacterized protein (TIGR03663 family)